ncbi:MAG: tetratricopeptide repeat protein [Phycisphaerales bacterium]
MHVAIAVHVGLWLYRGGSTLSPVEPSESMYTLETGAINAGFILFGIAILSTILFGRFFCGWACHVIALQDVCSWMLRRVKIRPKPFRSRLLVFVPLFFALYMFVWPTFRREVLWPTLSEQRVIPGAVGSPGATMTYRAWPDHLAWLGPVRPFPGFSVELMTPDFWETFAGPAVAVPFLFICGFAVVYFLGAKGFCTYGCPYGGFFAPADQISPGRIVVDHDKCHSCGHCTAACTSNVRVHEEIARFGMVVDPGCMKCLDCVSVCPNDALAFKFAAPPILKSAKRGRANAKPVKRTFDLSWPEEIAVALVFAASFVVYRGLYGAVPLLMAIGVAGCVTFIVWKLWRLPLDRNLRLHNFQLRLKGRVRPAGLAFGAFALAVVALTLHSGYVHAAERRAGKLDDQVRVPSAQVFTPQRPPVPPEQLEAARKAIDIYSALVPISDGGGALLSTPRVDVRLAWLHSVVGEYAKAERALRRVLARGEAKENLAAQLVQIILLQGRIEDANAFAREVLDEHPHFHTVRDDLAARMVNAGRLPEAEAMFKAYLEKHPKEPRALITLAAIRAVGGRVPEAITTLEDAVQADPTFVPARQRLAGTLVVAGRTGEALPHLEEAERLAPHDPIVQLQLAELLDALGRREEAIKHAQRAQELQLEMARRANAPIPSPVGEPSATR